MKGLPTVWNFDWVTFDPSKNFSSILEGKLEQIEGMKKVLNEIK